MATQIFHPAGTPHVGRDTHGTQLTWFAFILIVIAMMALIPRAAAAGALLAAL